MLIHFTTSNIRFFSCILLFVNLSFAQAAVACDSAFALSADCKNSDPLPNDKCAPYLIKTIVLDAGHGGIDSGCRGSHTREKHIALAITKQVGASIKAYYPHINVIYTRTEDVAVPLHERAAIANRNNADLFVSIHCNYISVPTVKGSETYVMGLHRAKDNLDVAKRENASILLEDNYEKNYDYDPDSPEGHIMLSMFQNAYLEQSILLADFIEASFAHQKGRHSRGVKQAGFLVLRETTMPSVLIEAGFLSNAHEENYLETAHGQFEMADAIFQAFSNYKAAVEEQGNAMPIANVPSTIPVKLSLPVVPDRPALSAPKTTNSYKKATETKVVQASTFEKANMPAPSAAPQEVYTNDPFSTGQQMIIPQRSVQKTTVNTRDVQFRVQLAASPYALNISRGKWAELPYTIRNSVEAGLIKYQIKDFNSFSAALNAKEKANQLGFKDAFVVAYQGEQRIEIERAKTILGN